MKKKKGIRLIDSLSYLFKTKMVKGDSIVTVTYNEIINLSLFIPRIRKALHNLVYGYSGETHITYRLANRVEFNEYSQLLF